LFRKLHAIKTKADERVISSTSTGTSGTTATTTTTIPHNGSSSRRESTSTSSSSESEMTARPIGSKPILHNSGGGSGRQQRLKVDRSVVDEEMMSPRVGEKVGKVDGTDERLGGVGKEEEVEGAGKGKGKGVIPPSHTGSKSPVVTPTPSEGFVGLRERIVAFLSSRNRQSTVVQNRIATPSTSRGLMMRVADTVFGRPIGSLMIFLVLLFGIRRAIYTRRRNQMRTRSGNTSLTDLETVQSRIRERLRRRTDWGTWIQSWIWIVLKKIKDTVVMGTKITYV
jgi:hypothetical protein